MEFDIFFSISQTPDHNGHTPSEAEMFANYYAQLEAADRLGFGVAWLAQAHLSTQTQQSNSKPVVPHWKGEVGLCTDFCQLAMGWNNCVGVLNIYTIKKKHPPWKLFRDLGGGEKKIR